jgi:hypothetical protein
MTSTFFFREVTGGQAGKARQAETVGLMKESFDDSESQYLARYSHLKDSIAILTSWMR